MGCVSAGGMAEPDETLGSFGPVGGALFGTVMGGGEWVAAKSLGERIARTAQSAALGGGPIVPPGNGVERSVSRREAV
jgi:hypothetical protein